MRAREKAEATVVDWTPVPDAAGRFSSGVPDLDRLLAGGYRRGSFALVSLDESVLREDLDLLLFPTYLNMLYQSRGIVAILPSNDSPHEFRERLTRYVTRRRFDSRVRVMDYVGEDQRAPYVVSFHKEGAPTAARTPAADRRRALAKAVAGEREAKGTGNRPFLELFAAEIFETLMGAEAATKLYFQGVKRSRGLGNLALGILGPGLGCAPALRRMADVEIALHRDDLGLTVRGVHPAFARHVVSPDPALGAPRVALVPPPA